METDDSKPKVLLTLENDRVIVAKRYSFVDDGVDAGTVAQCDDGSSAFFLVTANPTNMEFYGIEVSNEASYAEKKKAVEAATGWSFDEEFEWLKTDDYGDVIPGTDTLGTITNWLNGPIDLEHPLMENWGDRTSTQYASGFSLMASLTDDEKRALDIREGNLGGPASSVPCVMTGASIEELNRNISEKGLSYVFIDADGPEEGFAW